jgi:hypothetical protein
MSLLEVRLLCFIQWVFAHGYACDPLEKASRTWPHLANRKHLTTDAADILWKQHEMKWMTKNSCERVKPDFF